MRLSVQPFFEINKNELQYVDTIHSQSQPRYIFARIHQKTLGTVFRLSYSITPSFSIQFYGQPFVSAGQYTNFKKITEPKSESFYQRFHEFDREITFLQNENTYYIDENADRTSDYSFYNPDFNFKQFRSNLVLRWEYLPGSTLFFVWSQGRTGFAATGNFFIESDFPDLFDIYPENVFLLKASHWFSF